MKLGKWIFAVLAILAVVFMMLIAVSIGMQNALGVIGSIIGLFAVMGCGFALKKRMREKGLL
ncbi:YlaF family protein [Metabacillus sp. RGM 3146]|uniref:YlaF family protein n=1 Tax=Metabacillus sp. RGM 3146 TaxID=3401092 RepID=UPI003B9B1CDF